MKTSVFKKLQYPDDNLKSKSLLCWSFSPRHARLHLTGLQSTSVPEENVKLASNVTSGTWTGHRVEHGAPCTHLFSGLTPEAQLPQNLPVLALVCPLGFWNNLIILSKTHLPMNGVPDRPHPSALQHYTRLGAAKAHFAFPVILLEQTKLSLGMASRQFNMKQGQTPAGAQLCVWTHCRCRSYLAHHPNLHLSAPSIPLMLHWLVLMWLEWRRYCVSVPKRAQPWELPGLISPLAFVCRWRWNLKTSKAWFSKPLNKTYSCLLPSPSTCPRRMAEVTGPSFVTFVICFFPPMALLPLSNQGDVSCLCSQPFILREWWLSSNSIKIESLEPAPN